MCRLSLRPTHSTDISVNATAPVQIATCAAVIETWSQYFSETHTKHPLITVFWLQPVSSGWPAGLTAKKLLTTREHADWKVALGPGCLLGIKQSAVCQVCSSQWRLRLEAGQILYQRSPVRSLTASKWDVSSRKKLSFMSTLLEHSQLPIAEILPRPSIQQNRCYYTPNTYTFIHSPSLSYQG